MSACGRILRDEVVLCLVEIHLAAASRFRALAGDLDRRAAELTPGGVDGVDATGGGDHQRGQRRAERLRRDAERRRVGADALKLA
jgi:hypothetical protein